MTIGRDNDNGNKEQKYAAKEVRGFMRYQMNSVEIGLETAEYRISGMVSLYKNRRLSDLLNDERGFVVLRNAKVLPVNSSNSSYQKQCLMVNKESIILAWEDSRHTSQQGPQVSSWKESERQLQVKGIDRNHNPLQTLLFQEL